MMVSKKNFSQNRSMPMYKKQAPGGRQFPSNQMLFSTSQIPDNPGYMDFNNMDLNNQTVVKNENGQDISKKKEPKNKQRNKQNVVNHQKFIHQNNVWQKNKNMQQQSQTVLPKSKYQMNAQRGGRMNTRSMTGNIGRGRINGMGRQHIPPPLPPPHNFQCPPMIPPLPHMGPMRPIPPMIMGPRPAPPPFIRRGGRRPPLNVNGIYKKPMFPGPIPPPMNMPIMPPLMGGPPPRMPMPFNNTMGPHVGKIKKQNPKIVKKLVKNKSTIKTLKNLQNQYPLDEPWVTEEIKVEHSKKTEIENQLKGKKDDDLFAQFKTQRDKFVELYESAREEYLKKKTETKDANANANDKQTNGKNEINTNLNDNANENANAKDNAQTNDG